MKKLYFQFKLRYILTIVVLTFVCIFVSKIAYTYADTQQELDDISTQIQEQESKIQELKQQEDYYRDSIAIKRKEVISLQGQLSILEDSHKKILSSIGQTEAEVSKTELEIINTKLKIEEKEQEISSEKTKVGEILRMMYWSDQQSLLEIILTNDSLSDFFNHIKYSKDLQNGIHKSLDKLATTQQGLQVENEVLSEKKDNLKTLQTTLEEKELRMELNKKA